MMTNQAKLYYHFTSASGSMWLCPKIVNNVLIIPKIVHSSFKTIYRFRMYHMTR